jgi:hypothetical protein
MSVAVIRSLRRPSPAAPAVDAALLTSARGGNPAAMARIYELTQHRVRCFARRLLGDDAAAEDLVQDVFVHLPRLLGRYRGDGPFEMFLLSIVSRPSSWSATAVFTQRVSASSCQRLSATDSCPLISRHGAGSGRDSGPCEPREERL